MLVSNTMTRVAHVHRSSLQHHQAWRSVLLGSPGVGKTQLSAHLGVAIRINAIEHGFGEYFISTHRLVEDPPVAHEERRLEHGLRV